MKSIQTKLMLLFLALISIPMIVLGISTYVNASNALETSNESAIEATARDTAKAIQQEIESIQRLLQLSTIDASVVRMFTEPSEASRDELFEYVQSMYEANSDLFESVVVVDNNKLAFMTNGNRDAEIDVSDRDYAPIVLGGQSVISDVLTSKATGNQVIVVAEPIVIDGQVQGAMLGTFLFSNIVKYVDAIQVGENGYGYMINDQGVLLAHPDEQKVADGYSLLGSDNEELEIIIQDMIAGNTATGFYTFEGVRKMASYTPVGLWTIAATANYDDYMSAAISIRNMTAVLVLIFVVIALVIAFVFARNIVKPIKILQNRMDQAGHGDLTVRTQVRSKDEVGQLSKSFNAMMDDQGTIVKQVREGSEELVALSQELAASSEEITAVSEESRSKSEVVAEEARKQSESIIEVSKALVELSSLVQLARNRAEEASGNTQESQETAMLGREKVSSIVTVMSDINEKSSTLSKAITDVDDISSRIAQITEAIINIADQTNLLALNATIEASRAGEQGKGFMVVADEIRKLAEQTNNESEAIRSLTSEMINKTSEAVESVKSSLEVIKDGVEKVDETDTFFLKIVDSVEFVKSNIDSIVDITRNEVATSSQIVTLIDNVSSSAEENGNNARLINNNISEQADAMETISSTSQETSSMAEVLQSLVEKFIIE